MKRLSKTVPLCYDESKKSGRVLPWKNAYTSPITCRKPSGWPKIWQRSCGMSPLWPFTAAWAWEKPPLPAVWPGASAAPFRSALPPIPSSMNTPESGRSATSICTVWEMPTPSMTSAGRIIWLRALCASPNGVRMFPVFSPKARWRCTSPASTMRPERSR